MHVRPRNIGGLTQPITGSSTIGKILSSFGGGGVGGWVTGGCPLLGEFCELSGRLLLPFVLLFGNVKEVLP